jgi:hypothetical protein
MNPSESKQGVFMKTLKKNVFSITKVTVFAGAVGLAMFSQGPKRVEFSHGSIEGIEKAVSQLARMNSSYGLGGGLTDNLTNLVRNAIGLAVGYSSHQAYVDLVCEGVDPGAQGCDGPPEAGIIGKLTEFINELPRIGQSAGINRCEDVPSSGSVTGTDDAGNQVTVLFQTPTHSIPSGWLNGGRVFSHRVEFSVTVTGIGTPQPANIAYEFDCGHDQAQAAYAGVTMLMDNVPGWHRNIAVYNGPVDAAHNGIQLFMAEHDPQNAAGIRVGDAVDIQYNPQTHAFGLWGTMQGHTDVQNNGRNVTLKIAMSGDYSAGKALVFTRAISWANAMNDSTNTIDPAVLGLQGTSDDQLEADPGNSDLASDLANDATISGSSFGSPGMETREGCIDVSQPNASLPPGDASCAGFSLSSPADSAPALDANGSFSIQWTYSQLTSVLEDF